MTADSGIPAGRPLISFQAHQLRHGEGAPYDFERMLAELIQATQGDAHLAFTHVGDWGIDVLSGDLNGVVTVWQAKYFLKGVLSGQLDKIEKSLRSALGYARQHGYRIDKWVLCIPTSMTPETFQAWQRKIVPIAQADDVELDVWDETRLRDLLDRPEAAHVREAYYHAYRPPAALAAEPHLRIVAAQHDPGRWRGGEQVRLGRDEFVVHDPVIERTPADGSWKLLHATAARLDANAATVRLHGLRIMRASASADRVRDGLQAQAVLLERVGGRGAVPTLLGSPEEPGLLTLVSTQPTGRSWQEMFGVGTPRLDPLAVPLAIGVLATVADGLEMVHRLGHAHRSLHGGSVIVSRDGRRGLLRDVGLAGLPRLADEGSDGYRAPEQASTARGVPGPATDIYQLAALLYHSCTGFAPTAGQILPVRAGMPVFPAELDSLLVRALDPDPDRRPGVGAFTAGLRDGGRRIVMGAAP